MPVAGAIVGGIGSIAGGIMGGNAAKKAANTQAAAEKYAADLQKQEADAALQFQKDNLAQQRSDAAPWLKAGTGAINQLSDLTGPNGKLIQGFDEKFAAPTDVTEQNDPGYAFRLAQGMKALQNSAAAKGQTFDPNTAKALTRYGQDYASNEYGNVYNRALGEYQQRYNIFNQNQANQFNRLSAVAGGGQTAVGQLNSAGQNAANQSGGILMNYANQASNAATGAANARASGYVGAANAYTNAFSGLGNAINLYALTRNQDSGGYQGMPLSA